MTFNDFFKEERDFEKAVIDVYNFELTTATALTKMEKATKDKSLRERLNKMKEKSQMQVQRMEDLCDIYDIAPEGRTSLAVENLVAELEKQKMDEHFLSDEEINKQAAEIEKTEKWRLTNTLSLARGLQYQEAVDILSEAANAAGSGSGGKSGKLHSA